MATECLYDGLENVPNNWVLHAIILVDGAMFLKASLHGLKKRGGVGAAPPPPPICKTPLSRVPKVHMGSVFAGKVILEATLRSLKIMPGVWGEAALRLQTDCVYYEFNKAFYKNDVFDALNYFLLMVRLSRKLDGVKIKRGARGLGGAQPPPQLANTFITGFERVHMGSVLAGKMIPDATLHSVKITRGDWGDAAPHLQQIACMMTLKFHNNYVFDAILVDGAMFLKASRTAESGGRGGGGGAAPSPSCANTFITGSEILKGPYGICLCW